VSVSRRLRAPSRVMCLPTVCAWLCGREVGTVVAASFVRTLPACTLRRGCVCAVTQCLGCVCAVTPTTGQVHRLLDLPHQAHAVHSHESDHRHGLARHADVAGTREFVFDAVRGVWAVGEVCGCGWLPLLVVEMPPRVRW
jgi:hypothetical protein